MKDTNTIGKRIKAMRLRKGLTQEQLAEILYMKKVTLSAYENDRIDIKSSIVVDLAKVLNCTVSYLMEGHEQEKEAEEQDELVKIIRKLKSDKLRKVALEQMKVLAQIENL